MCNPRKIRIQATHELSAAWDAEIIRTAQATGLATGEARANEDLSELLSERALAAFQRALDGDERWQWHDGSYEFAVDGGRMVFDPETAELEIVTQLNDQITVSGEARRTVAGTVTVTGDATAEATYYRDNWLGRSRSVAQSEARSMAEELAGEDARRRMAEQYESTRARGRETLRASTSEVEAEAYADARRRLAETAAARGVELDAEAATRLAAIQAECMAAVHQALASGYREAILAYARQHGATNLRTSEDGGVIEIEFEIGR